MACKKPAVLVVAAGRRRAHDDSELLPLVGFGRGGRRSAAFANTPASRMAPAAMAERRGIYRAADRAAAGVPIALLTRGITSFASSSIERRDSAASVQSTPQ